jgi:circadian clock protein KaiB
MTPGDRRAVANLERICREHLPGRCSLEIVDLREDPARAEQDQILAVPTLVRHRPAPRRKVIGDLSLIDRVLAGLEIEPDPGAAGAEQEH